MKTQVLRFTFILLSSLIFPTFLPVCAAQTQDYSRVNLPDGAVVRLGKGGVSYEDRGIAFSPDGSRLAVATSMGVWLYDVETFDEIALLTGHTRKVTAVAFSSDGKKLASVTGMYWHRILKIWDVETGQNLTILQAEKGYADSVAFSPDDTKLAWAGRLWDVETRQQFDRLQDNRLSNVAFSPDGKILAGTDRRTFPRTSRNDVTMQEGIIKLYDIETGQTLNTLIATQRTKWGKPRGRVTSIAFSPDSTTIVSGAGHEVKLWAVETGENIATFQVERGSVNSTAFSPDGTKLAVGSAEGINLLEIPTGKHIYTRQHIDVGELEFSVEVFSVAFSLDGRKLASASWACLGIMGWC